MQEPSKNLGQLCQRYHRDILNGHPFQKIFEPRRVQAPAGYASVKQIACTLDMAWQTGIAAIQQHAQDLRITQLSLITQILNSSVPIYFVMPALTKAILATKLDESIHFGDFKFPAEGFVLSYPHELLHDYSGEDTDYICCAHMPEGKIEPRDIPGAPTMESPHERIGTLYLTWRNHPEIRISVRQSNELLSDSFAKYTFEDLTGLKTAAETTNDREKTRKIDALVYKTLLILNTAPELLHQGQARQRSKKKETLWEPNVIGKDYHEPIEGSHSSPKLHRREGHITHQAIGRKEDLITKSSLPHTPDNKIDWNQVDTATREQFWKSHVLRWIKPMLVGYQKS